MNGVDAITFTAGVGENDTQMREEICEYLGYLGVKIDKEKNAQARGVGFLSLSPAIYERLIKAGCDVNERFFESKQSPLHLVCTKEKPAERLIPLIELLINAGADPNQPDVDGLTPLMTCNSPEIAVCLMNHGANPSLRNDDGQTAYDFHMKNGYPPIRGSHQALAVQAEKGETR